jgi:molybdate transport system substrate-binding protein
MATPRSLADSRFLALALALGACRHGETEPLRVAAAADLALAFADVGAAFEKKTGQRVVFSFGASGLLERQIAEGAPFDVFAAADVSYADEAIRAGACRADSRTVYATGRIVLFPAKDAAFKPRTLQDLADPRIAKIAIANPDHAPYGRAARQAMQRAGVWESVRGKLVLGENVQQALQFALSGNADVAIVAHSLTIAAAEQAGDVTPIPAALYDPLQQALVVCSNGKAGPDRGAGFAQFLQSSEGHAILRKYGFVLPGEREGSTATGVPEPPKL